MWCASLLLANNLECEHVGEPRELMCLEFIYDDAHMGDGVVQEWGVVAEL